MSAIGDELDRAAESPRPRQQDGLPERYRQFAESDGDKLTGQVTWYDGQPRPDESAMLQTLGHDPAEWKIDRFKHSRWEQKPDVWLNALGVFASKREPADPTIIAADLDILMQDISKWKPRAQHRFNLNKNGPKAAFSHQIGDIQMGKGEDGGSPATINRVLGSLQGGLDGLDNLRRLGFQISKVCLPSTGDLVEQTAGFYPMQTFDVDMDMRTQRREATKLFMAHIRAYAQRSDEVFVTGIAANHGENRNGDGKAYTSFHDNDDLLILDWCKSICEEARYDNVVFDIPTVDPLVHSFTAEGVTVAIAHGHQFSKGQGAANKAHEWLKGQMLGDRVPRDIRLLMTGHFHSFQAAEFSKDVGWVQCPAQDGGSYWFSASTGLSSRTGALTMLLGDNVSERGYDHLRVV